MNCQISPAFSFFSVAKKTLLFAQASVSESGKIFTPTHAPGVDDFIHELTSFLREHLDEPALLTYYRREVERLGWA
ncbi:MAG: hypothetical protein ABL880_08560 [Methylotenera sp.]